MKTLQKRGRFGVAVAKGMQWCGPDAESGEKDWSFNEKKIIRECQSTREKKVGANDKCEKVRQ